MSAEYLSYLMGASQIADGELSAIGVEIVGRKENGSRELHIPVVSRVAYEALITEKLDAGFWNDLVSEDEIIFIFKLKDGTVKRLVFSEETHDEIGELCAQLSGEPIEKTRHVLSFLVRTPFYVDVVRRYHYAHLPRKWAATGGLFLNAVGNVLLVKPTYKPLWSVVGGNIDAGEVPSRGFVREVQEEIGLIIDNPQLRCVQYVTDPSYQGDRIQFIFDGGVLTNEQISRIRVDHGEISEFRFVSLDEATAMLGDGLAVRIAAAYKARRENTIAYLEQRL